MGSHSFREELQSGLMAALGESHPELLSRFLAKERLDRFEAHHRLMVKWNPKLNLTRVFGEEESARKHFLESLLAGTLLELDETAILDLGSGAGFPGLPLGVAFPEKNLFLLEGDTRKSVFLKEASRNYPNIAVINERSDRFLERNALRFDCVVSRAVSWSDLSEVSLALNCPCIWITSQEEFRKIQNPTCHVERSLPLPGNAGIILRTCHMEPSRG